MRSSIHKLFGKPIVYLFIIVGIAVTSFLWSNLSFFVGLAIAFLALWSGKFNWSEFGIHKPEWGKTVILAMAYAVIVYVSFDFTVNPFIEYFFGETDLSAFNGLRGNFVNYLIMIAIMWVIAGLGEEFLYRGFYMHRLVLIMKNTKLAWIVAGITSSILFGVVHLYQGYSGAISTGIIGLILAWLFYKNQKNLVLLMFVHGFFDVIGITLIYLDSERIIIDFVTEMLGL